MEFASTLRQLREKAGYASARAFYRGRRGASFFGCTYKAYLNIEAGRSNPQAGLAMKIAVALGVSEDSARAKEYVSAYLRSLVGRPELASFLLRVLAPSGKDGGQGLFHRASEVGFQEKAVPLTREQCDLLCSDGDRYWCFTIVSDDGGRWTPSEMSKLFGFPEARMRKALQALVKAGLLAVKDGRFYCPEAGRVFRFPRDKFFIPDYMPALKAHWSAMAAKRGATLLDRHILLRASEAGLRNYFPYLAQSVNASHIYSVTEKGPDTAMVAVEMQVQKLLSF